MVRGWGKGSLSSLSGYLHHEFCLESPVASWLGSGKFQKEEMGQEEWTVPSQLDLRLGEAKWCRAGKWRVDSLSFLRLSWMDLFLYFFTLFLVGIEKGCWVCVLVLYLSAFLDIFSSCSRFLREPLRPFMCRTLPTEKKAILTSFPICTPLIIFTCLA